MHPIIAIDVEMWRRFWKLVAKEKLRRRTVGRAKDLKEVFDNDSNSFVTQSNLCMDPRVNLEHSWSPTFCRQ